MSKIFIAVALLAVAVYAAPPAPPTGKLYSKYLPLTMKLSAEEVKKQLTDAGLSAGAADGVVAVAEKFKDQLEAAKGDKDAAMKLFEQIKTETDAYIKTQSAADQAAYQTFVEQKKKEMEAHHSTPSH
ncbi:Protein CBG19068 [Caenorhabditis briggsae]|uniref:Protein CBG19068 n=1 Tax=Caenorhabditis briggsae TaxID=6238 RepID=A8XUQ0_CAEBR|nr:Protein CBG19068 [Caenorhabditis briggsae]CAP36375.2 Protein CBG19068 [Caenorhabditis briggsae]